MPDSRSRPFQPTLLGAAWQYRLFLLVFAVLFGLAGWYYGTSSQTWTATATMTVQDPRSLAVFDTDAGLDPKRHAANQAEIVRSHAVAEVTATMLSAGDPPISLSPGSIEQGLIVGSASAADVIVISFSHPDKNVAIATANTVIDAYREVNRATAAGAYASGIAELDDAIADFESDLSAIGSQLAANAEASDTHATLQLALDGAIAALLRLDVPDPAATPEALTEFANRFGELERQVAAFEMALEAADLPPNNDALLQQQDEIRVQLVALKLRRDELTVDAEVAGSGISFVGEARKAEPSSVVILAIAGALAGALAGIALAFFLANQRRHFRSRTEPQVVLGTNLIADIPHFESEKLRTLLPAIEAPASTVAESFRFVAGGLARKRSSDSPANGAVAVAVVAASHMEGNTTVAANTALAAARAGSRVALIDADLGTQSLSVLLGELGHLGLTDVAADGRDAAKVGQDIAVTGSGRLTLFGPGLAAASSPDFFSSPRAAVVMDQLRTAYDLVLVDVPPLLRVAYSAGAVRLVDSALVVIGHGSSAPEAAELRNQLLTIGTPMIGYVYNRAPLRREMIRTGNHSLDHDPEAS